MARSFKFPREWREDPRRNLLIARLRGSQPADGAMVTAWMLGEDPWIESWGKRGIPLLLWVHYQMPHALEELGLAVIDQNLKEVFIAHMTHVWDFVFPQVMKGKKSAASRLKKYGTSKPLVRPRTAVQPKINSKPNLGSVDSRTAAEPPLSSHSVLVPHSSFCIVEETVHQNSGIPNLGSEMHRTAVHSVNHGSGDNLAIHVDKFGFWCGKTGLFDNAPLRQPHFSYEATDGSLALNPWEGTKTLLEGRIDGPEVLRLVESDNVYPDKLRQVNIPDEIPSCGSVRLLRIYPQYEDFQSHAEWTLAQYPPINAISAYRESIRCRPRDYQDAQAAALRRLREELNLDVFRIAAAIRDVQRNGTLEKRAHPKEGIAVYLLSRAKLILSRIESHRYQQERRKLAAGRARMRRRFQERSPRVHAFRDAFRDRRARRLEMDRQRELYPVIFREVPRSSVAELSVCAGLWVQR